MTEDMNELMGTFTASTVLIAILEEIKEVRVPTLSFLKSGETEKQLVVDYDETGPAFIFKIAEPKNNEEQSSQPLF